MAMKKTDPREQFSKKLAKWTAVFTFLYLVLLVLAMCYQPDIADASVYLGVGALILLMINVGAYTHNSIYEKAILNGLTQIGKLRLTWKGRKTSSIDAKADNDEDEGEGGNG